MKSNSELKFADIQVTQEQIVAEVLHYEGLPYREGNTWTYTDEGNGKMVGYANCYGILLLTAKGLGLLPWNFDVNIPPDKWKQSEAKTLWEIIHLNFDEIQDRLGFQRGDVLLMRYRDVDRGLKEPHHVGMIVKEVEFVSHAQMIHASGSTGNVVVQEVDVLFHQRIESIWRMKNVKE